MIGFNKPETEGTGGAPDELICHGQVNAAFGSFSDGHVVNIPESALFITGFWNQSNSFSSDTVSVPAESAVTAPIVRKAFSDCKARISICNYDSLDIVGDLTFHICRATALDMGFDGTADVDFTSIAEATITDLDAGEKKEVTISTGAALATGDRVYIWVQNETGGTLSSFMNFHYGFIIEGIA